MLSPPDADLVRRDPALPALATLLDTEAFVATLASSVPEARLGPARSTYVRYKRGMNCLVAYELEVDGREVEVYAKAHGPDTAVKLRKAHERQSTPGPLGDGRITLKDSAIVLYTFPNDSKLRSLPRLVGTDARKVLRDLIPGSPDLWEGTLRSIRYKPERRYVAGLSAGNHTGAVLKLYTEPHYRAARKKARLFESRATLGIARRLGESDRRYALAFEWLPGRTLSEALSDPELHHEAVTQTGSALARLHAQSPEGLANLSQEAEAASLHTVAETIGYICPRLDGKVKDLARRLISRLARNRPIASSAIHGDFDAGQVLLTNGGVVVLDLDRAVLGDPAVDLGLFIANLERDTLRGHLSPDRLQSLSDGLLEGYQETARQPIRDRVGPYTAAGLLRLSSEPFRYREPEWPELTEAMLERAETILLDSSTPTMSAN